MYARRHFEFWRQGLPFTYQILVVMFVWSGLLTATYVFLDAKWLAIPALPVSILGTAVSFYLGFKGNSAYERLWECVSHRV